MIDYHSYGAADPLSRGLAGGDAATDTPIFTSAGRPRRGQHGDQGPRSRTSRRELYTTNGDITDDAYDAFGSLAFTVELDGRLRRAGRRHRTGPSAYTPAGFVFQDADAAIEAEFQDNLGFALDLARSAQDPDDPVSHIGNVAPASCPRRSTGPTATRSSSRSTRSGRSAPSRPTGSVEAGETGADRCASGRAACATARPASTTTAARPRHRAQPGHQFAVWFSAAAAGPRARSRSRCLRRPAPAR